MTKKAGTIHFVSHTHWDREWYDTFQEFRIRMVDLVDRLLDIMETDPNYRHYLLDGQSCLVEDYLEIRPENRARIEVLARAGRLRLGPWYVLADEYLPTAEQHVRNMLIGNRIAKRYGAKIGRVAYNPDQFGHIAQMPQILRGLGFDAVYLARGYDISQSGNEFMWRAPDGSEVLAICYGYGNFAGLPARAAEVKQRVNELLEGEWKSARTSNLLATNGTDHIPPQKELPRILELVDKHTAYRAVHSTLEMFAREVRKKAKLRTVRGELRWNMFCEGVSLHGVHSSRMYLKQANRSAERALLHSAEPLCSYLHLIGEEFPAAFLEKAWKYLLLNQPHDSICGCSIDAVHDHMMDRFASSQEIAEYLVTRGLVMLGRRIELPPVAKGEEESHSFLAVNTLPRRRTGIFNVKVPVSGERGSRGEIEFADPRGRTLRSQAVAERIVGEWNLGTEMKNTESTGWLSQRQVVALEVEDLPAGGYRVIHTGRGRVKSGSSDLGAGKNRAENSLIKIRFRADGSFDLLDKRTGRLYSRVHYLEDGGDVGGGYCCLAPEQDSVLSTRRGKAKVELVEKGPVYVRFRIEWNWPLPVSASQDYKRRSKRLVKNRIVTYLTMYRKSARLDLRTVVDNRSKDHRMRACFPTGLEAEVVHCDGHFEVVERSIRDKPWPTEPQLRWVDITDGKCGLAVINHGLPEYEIADDESRTIRLTLFRSFTAQERGWFPYVRTPAAAMLGTQTFEYALFPHRGDWEKGKVNKQAEDFCAPPLCRMVCEMFGHSVSRTGRPPRRTLPLEDELLTLDSAYCVFSALKKAELRRSLILRIYNPGSNTDSARASGGWIKEAFLTDLRERRGRKVAVREGVLKVQVPSKRIVTLELVPRR